MEHFIQRNKFILVLAALVICLSTAYGLTVKLDPFVNASNQDEAASNYSWSSVAEAAAQYLGHTMSPEGNGGEGIEIPPLTGSNSNPMFAGCFLGYMDPSHQFSKYTVASIESGDTVSYSYNALANLHTSFDNGGSEWRNSALIYAGYGYALSASGIDETVIIGQTADDKRNIIGPIVLIIFLLCIALPEFFRMILTFLSVANPFQLFFGSGSVLSSYQSALTDTTFTNSSSAITASMANGIRTLQNMATGLYTTLYNMSFAVTIPIMLAIALFSWLVLRQRAGSAFKKLLIRVVFAGLGVPLLLACYSAAIDSVKDFMINNTVGTPISVIASTFCDYGSWALGNENVNSVGALGAVTLPYLGDGGEMIVDQSGDYWSYKADDSVNDRVLVARLNASSIGLSNSVTLGLNAAMNADASAKNSERLFNSTSGGASVFTTSKVIEMLQRYTKGEYFTAANYASKAIRYYANTTNREKYMAVFQSSNDWRDYDPKKAVGYKYEANDGSSFVVDISEEAAKQFAAGRLNGHYGDYGGNFAGSNPFYPANSSDAIVYKGGVGGDVKYGGVSAMEYGGRKSTLPPIAIYNLLSTQFTDSEAIVYSAPSASTNQVQLAHYSVSIAGSGYMELAYVLDACAIMGCFMVLGYGYGFALLFACFKSLIQMVPKVLTGMLGSLAGIAGAVILTAALIIEIVGTCVMYALASTFIGGIYNIIERPLASLLGSSGLGLPTQAVSMVVVAASGLIIIRLTASLLDYRKAVVKGVSETATSMVNKFMQTNVVAPNLEAPVTASGVASAAMGTAMVLGATPAGSGLADRANSLVDKATDVDAGKVASAALGTGGTTGSYGVKYSSEEEAKASRETAGGGSGSSVYNSGSSLTAGSGSSYTSSGSTPATEDDAASQYVADSQEDFEASVGYAPSEGGTYEDEGGSGSIADNSQNLENTSMAGTVTYDNGESEVYNADGQVVEAFDEKGNSKLVDNSGAEIVGTSTTDITDTKTAEADTEVSAKLAPVDSSVSETTASGSSGTANKLVMTSPDGTVQEVSLVNAETGAAYTQADKDAGVSYNVVDSSGKSIYPGLEGGMSANTLAMNNGEATVMIGAGKNGDGSYNAFGGGGVYTLSAPQVTENVNQSVNQNVNQSSTASSTSSSTTNVQAGSEGGTTVVNGGGSGYEGGGASVVHTEGSSSAAPINVNVAQNQVVEGSPGSNVFIPTGGSSDVTVSPYLTASVVANATGQGGDAPAQQTFVQNTTQNNTTSYQTDSGFGGGGGSRDGGSSVVNNTTYNNVNNSQSSNTNTTNNNQPGTASIADTTGKPKKRR